MVSDRAFYGLKQVLTANSLQGIQNVFLNENLGHLTLIFLLKITPSLPFGRWYFPTIFRDLCHLC